MWKSQQANRFRFRSAGRNALVAFATSTVLFAFSRRASAQLDTNPPLQNVLLLVDSSGSMEYASDGSAVTCDQVDTSLAPADGPQGLSQKTRWTQLVEVLTGDVKDYACYTQDRRSDAFRDEYKLGSTLPYDYNYHVPYHRIVSGSGASGCTIGAGVVDANPFSWGTTPFKYHLWNNAATACSGVAQSETGLLDSYRDRMRFGLMTFDTSVNAGTGLSGLSTADSATGAAGTWSYFLNWRSQPDCNVNGSCAKGRPAGCSAATPLEVGARNAAAPPWEGRMVPFGSPASSITDVRTTNDRVQQVLLSLRPFGATPINGLLSDARDFFLNDGDDDYVGGATCNHTTGVGCFGPKYDGLTKYGCRTNNIILLTDGEPNLDLRPYCEGTSGGFDGVCPYADKTFEIVQQLADPNGPNIKTFVIGFAVSTVDTGQPQVVDCSQISTPGKLGTGDTFDPNGFCGPSMDPKLSACCTLAKIAFYGHTTNPYFANNATELRTAISAILSRIGGAVSTRTLPVFASNTSGQSGGAFSFLSSFQSGNGTVWSGVLERQRITCVSDPSTHTMSPKAENVDSNQGDVFSDNVNAADGSHPRNFYTVIAADDGAGNVRSDRSIRPTLSSDVDGIGVLNGSAKNGTVANFFPPLFSAAAMQVTKTSCTDVPLPGTDDQCGQMFMKWEIGADNTPYQFTRTNVFGAIYHSTPTLVGPPSEFLRDESYTQFQVDQAKRPPVLYTATTDGQLHAFKVDKLANDQSDTFAVDKKVNNELWSFFPPAVLPRIPAQYPNTQQIILDGAPVVKDVVFARSDADAKNGGASVHWHTVLVSGFGGGGTGYFALDVTKPVPKAGDDTTGPQMLWQLTTDAAGNRLFGKRSGTPAITTLFFGPGGTDPQEYAVAILPGGESDGPMPGACQRLASADHVDSSYGPRDNVRCWADDPARSLTIVRLDTGEIVRSFRRQADGPASVLGRSHDGSNTYALLSAPISGTPVVFPANTGEVADRAFVGDRDGLIWRIDLSKQNPQEWTMTLFFDTYTGKAYDAGQPIATPPVLSVDTLGNVTMAVSTGDQESFLETPGMVNFLWSLKEDATSTVPFSSKVLWDLSTTSSTDPPALTDGKRISGPMQLFNSNLYFTVYTPPPASPTGADQCSSGRSQLCAMHYMRAAATAHTGGEPATPALDPQNASHTCIDQGDAVVFGPSITQEPTCSQDETYNDPYLGVSQSKSLGNVTPGNFVIKLQTGSHGKNETGGQINTSTINLLPPLSMTRIDSWAGVVE